MLTLALATLLAKPLVVGYVMLRDDLTDQAGGIDYARLTHLNLAFENPEDDEGNLSFDPAKAAFVAQGHAKGVKVLMSIGGGGVAGDPATMKRYFYLLSPTRRAGFVAKLAAYVEAHSLDGIDVDLEGPSINGDYGPFVRDLGAALHAKGKLLTAALSQGYGGDQVPGEALKAFDFVNVMAYDATGPWRPKEPGQHSSMELAKSSVAYWRGRGLPKERTVLGVPFYGYGFGASQGEWPYRRILETYPGADRLDQVGDTIWYNGVPTIQAKARFIREQGLAGAMIWSLESDAPGEQSLLTALDSALNPKR